MIELCFIDKEAQQKAPRSRQDLPADAYLVRVGFAKNCIVISMLHQNHEVFGNFKNFFDPLFLFLQKNFPLPIVLQNDARINDQLLQLSRLCMNRKTLYGGYGFIAPEAEVRVPWFYEASDHQGSLTHNDQQSDLLQNDVNSNASALVAVHQDPRQQEQLKAFYQSVNFLQFLKIVNVEVNKVVQDLNKIGMIIHGSESVSHIHSRLFEIAGKGDQFGFPIGSNLNDVKQMATQLIEEYLYRPLRMEYGNLLCCDNLVYGRKYRNVNEMINYLIQKNKIREECQQYFRQYATLVCNSYVPMMVYPNGQDLQNVLQILNETYAGQFNSFPEIETLKAATTNQPKKQSLQIKQKQSGSQSQGSHFFVPPGNDLLSPPERKKRKIGNYQLIHDQLLQQQQSSSLDPNRSLMDSQSFLPVNSRMMQLTNSYFATAPSAHPTPVVQNPNFTNRFFPTNDNSTMRLPQFAAYEPVGFYQVVVELGFNHFVTLQLSGRWLNDHSCGINSMIVVNVNNSQNLQGRIVEIRGVNQLDQNTSHSSHQNQNQNQPAHSSRSINPQTLFGGVYQQSRKGNHSQVNALTTTSTVQSFPALPRECDFPQQQTMKK